MSLTGTGLPVSEDGTVVTLQDIGNNWGSGLVINLFLLGVIAVSVIECELFWLLLGVWSLYQDLIAILINLHSLCVSCLNLLVIHGPAPDCDLDGLILVLAHLAQFFSFNHVYRVVVVLCVFVFALHLLARSIYFLDKSLLNQSHPPLFQIQIY